MTWYEFYNINIVNKTKHDSFIQEIVNLFETVFCKDSPLTAWYNEYDKFWTLLYRTNNSSNYGYFDIELHESGCMLLSCSFKWNNELINFETKKETTITKIRSCLIILLILDYLFIIGIPIPVVYFDEDNISSIEWDNENEYMIVAHYIDLNKICYSIVGDRNVYGEILLNKLNELEPIFIKGEKSE